MKKKLKKINLRELNKRFLLQKKIINNLKLKFNIMLQRQDKFEQKFDKLLHTLLDEYENFMKRKK